MATNLPTNLYLTAEADRKVHMADRADRAGRAALRDAYLRQAAEGYRAAGLGHLADLCEGNLGIVRSSPSEESDPWKSRFSSC